MNIIKEKNQLRADFRKKRAALSKEEVTEKSQKITQNFIQNLLPKIFQKNSAQIFSLYLNSKNEVQTSAIAEFLQKNNIKFSYPKIIKPDQHLQFILYSSEQKFSVSSLFPSIAEPQDGEKILPDILIIPLLAFDDDLSRLGMGGGFFDRSIEFLKQQKSKIITIGLAFDIQRFDGKLPIENSDCALDFIVTETGIFTRFL